MGGGITALRGRYLHHQNLSEMEKAQHFAEEGLRVRRPLSEIGMVARRLIDREFTGKAVLHVV